MKTVQECISTDREVCSGSAVSCFLINYGQHGDTRCNDRPGWCCQVSMVTTSLHTSAHKPLCNVEKAQTYTDTAMINTNCHSFDWRDLLWGPWRGTKPQPIKCIDTFSKITVTLYILTSRLIRSECTDYVSKGTTLEALLASHLRRCVHHISLLWSLATRDLLTQTWRGWQCLGAATPPTVLTARPAWIWLTELVARKIKTVFSVTTLTGSTVTSGKANYISGERGLFMSNHVHFEVQYHHTQSPLEQHGWQYIKFT